MIRTVADIAATSLEALGFIAFMAVIMGGFVVLDWAVQQ